MPSGLLAPKTKLKAGCRGLLNITNLWWTKCLITKPAKRMKIGN